MDEEVIKLVFNSQTFGRNRSASIVGGLQRLLDLIGQGKIRAEKKGKAQNSKWHCNAYDVIKYAKCNRI